MEGLLRRGALKWRSRARYILAGAWLEPCFLGGHKISFAEAFLPKPYFGNNSVHSLGGG